MRGSFLLSSMLLLCHHSMLTRSFSSSALRRPFKRMLVTKMSTGERQNVCIIGGGFGGLYTAIKLSQMKETKDKLNIHLFDPKDKFVFLPLLYELAVGSASVVEVAPKFDTLLKNTGINFVQSSVTDVRDGKVFVRSKYSDEEKCFPYDHLVIAAGAQPRTDIIPGAANFSLPFCRVEDAYKLKTQLRLLTTNNDLPVIRVAVIGGGYSGVEVATSVARFIGKDRAVVSIVDRNDKVMKFSPSHNRATAEKSLISYGVSLNLNSSVKEITADGVIIQEKGDDSPEFKIPADLVILTSGTAPSSLVSAINWLPKDKSGRIRVSRTLQVAEHPSVFALGDCAAVEGVQVPATAQVAMQQTDIVARNIASLAIGVTTEEALQKFKFVDLGQMLTLGGSVADGAVTSFGGLVKLQGPLAAVARRGVYAVRMPTSSQRLTAAFSAGAVSVASLVKDTTSFLTKKNL